MYLLSFFFSFYLWAGRVSSFQYSCRFVSSLLYFFRFLFASLDSRASNTCKSSLRLIEREKKRKTTERNENNNNLFMLMKSCLCWNIQKSRLSTRAISSLWFCARAFHLRIISKTKITIYFVFSDRWKCGSVACSSVYLLCNSKF